MLHFISSGIALDLVEKGRVQVKYIPKGINVDFHCCDDNSVRDLPAGTQVFWQ